MWFGMVGFTPEVTGWTSWATASTTGGAAGALAEAAVTGVVTWVVFGSGRTAGVALAGCAGVLLLVTTAGAVGSGVGAGEEKAAGPALAGAAGGGGDVASTAGGVLGRATAAVDGLTVGVVGVVGGALG
jgi:hypothetical protein